MGMTKYDQYQGASSSVVYKCFDKKYTGSGAAAITNEVTPNQ